MNFSVQDKTKDERQREGVEKWFKSGRRGTLNYVMRFGKTRVACIIIGEILKQNPESRIIITVPSDIVKKTWAIQIHKYSDGEILPENAFNDYKIVLVTANEVINAFIPVTFDLLIVDEIHKFTSDARLNIINGTKVKYKMILGLTGTFPDRKERDEINKYCPVIDSISEEVAIQNNWTSNFVEYNIPLQLRDNDKQEYINLSIPIAKTLKQFRGTAKLFQISPGEFIFKSDYDVITACYSGKAYKGKFINSQAIREVLAESMGWSKELDLDKERDREIDNLWNPNILYDLANTFNNSIRSRSEIINNNPVKLAAVIQIFKHSPITTICFNESTDFADQIVRAINYEFKGREIAVAYHTNIQSKFLIDPKTGSYYTYSTGANAGRPKLFGKQSLKKYALEGMLTGKYKFLSTARALDEGLDLSNIKQVITTAGTTNPLQYKQRNARGKTVDIYDPDKITKIFNLYFDDFYDINSITSTGEPKLINCRDKSKLKLRQGEHEKIKWVANISEATKTK